MLRDKNGTVIQGMHRLPLLFNAVVGNWPISDDRFMVQQLQKDGLLDEYCQITGKGYDALLFGLRAHLSDMETRTKVGERWGMNETAADARLRELTK